MKPLTLFASSLTVLSLLLSAGAFAHEPGASAETVKVLQDEMLLNAPGKKALLVFMVLAPDEEILIPLEK